MVVISLFFIIIFAGTPVPVTWTYLAETADIGTDQITLMQSVTWKPDDKIVIASTGDRHSQRENEEVTITGGCITVFNPILLTPLNFMQYCTKWL